MFSAVLADRDAGESVAQGEEIIIAKNGIARARLVPITERRAARQPANALRLSRIADDFDLPDPAIARVFAGGDRHAHQDRRCL